MDDAMDDVVSWIHPILPLDRSKVPISFLFNFNDR